MWRSEGSSGVLASEISPGGLVGAWWSHCAGFWVGMWSLTERELECDEMVVNREKFLLKE